MRCCKTISDVSCEHQCCCALTREVFFYHSSALRALLWAHDAHSKKWPIRGSSRSRTLSEMLQIISGAMLVDSESQTLVKSLDIMLLMPPQKTLNHSVQLCMRVKKAHIQSVLLSPGQDMLALGGAMCLHSFRFDSSTVQLKISIFQPSYTVHILYTVCIFIIYIAIIYTNKIDFSSCFERLLIKSGCAFRFTNILKQNWSILLNMCHDKKVTLYKTN